MLWLRHSTAEGPAYEHVPPHLDGTYIQASHRVWVEQVRKSLRCWWPGYVALTLFLITSWTCNAIKIYQTSCHDLMYTHVNSHVITILSIFTESCCGHCFILSRIFKRLAGPVVLKLSQLYLLIVTQTGLLPVSWIFHGILCPESCEASFRVPLLLGFLTLSPSL